MKRFVITALMLLSAAKAQAPTVEPAPPTPAAQAPLSSVLSLSAQVGSSTELILSQKAQMKIDSAEVIPLTGSKIKEADLTKIRKDLAETIKDSEKILPQANLTGKVFSRLQSRDDSGNVTLVSSVILNNSYEKNQKNTFQPIKIIQKYDINGNMLDAKLDNGDKNLSKYTNETIQQLIKQNSGIMAIYGQPLEVGKVVSKTFSVDMQAIFGNILDTMVGGASKDLFGKLQANPITYNMDTIFIGVQNDMYVFNSKTNINPWSIEVSGNDKNFPGVNLSLSQSNQEIITKFRKDGLQASMSSTVSTKMAITIEDKASGVQVKINISAGSVISTAPKSP